MVSKHKPKLQKIKQSCCGSLWEVHAQDCGWKSKQTVLIVRGFKETGTKTECFRQRLDRGLQYEIKHVFFEN